MPRQPRICIPGGLYHVISRGAVGGPIVLDDLDREGFLGILAGVVKRFSWLCHAYCLMDTHYHLVVETPLPNLSDGMRQLNGVYAQTFNDTHGLFGHVFASRYRSILVEDETYLVELCRYVVLNPVRAGACSSPADWPWSSYAATVGLVPAPPFLTTERTLSDFGATHEQAQRSYSLYVNDGIATGSDPVGV